MRQFIALTPQEFVSTLCREGLQPPLPSTPYGHPARARCAPFRPNILGDHKGRVVPAKALTRPGDLTRAKRRAVRRSRSSLGRRSKSDRRPAGDQARAVALLGPPDGLGDRLVIMPVDPLGGPAIRLKP